MWADSFPHNADFSIHVVKIEGKHYVQLRCNMCAKPLGATGHMSLHDFIAQAEQHYVEHHEFNHIDQSRMDDEMLNG